MTYSGVPVTREEDAAFERLEGELADRDAEAYAAGYADFLNSVAHRCRCCSNCGVCQDVQQGAGCDMCGCEDE